MAENPGGAGRSSRREFLAASTAAAGILASQAGVFAGGSDVLRLGLVGCGGRGTGAAGNALTADPQTKLVAIGDTFSDRVDGCMKELSSGKFASRIDIPKDRQFIGFDCYKQVIDAGIDVVLLCTPPHFRPMQMKYAVEKGKHMFVEKPVAVDGPGVREVFDHCRDAKQKGLAIVSGLCWRYHMGMRATFDKLHEGGVGDYRAIQATYHTKTLKKHPRQPQWSDMEFQVRNWNGFNWLSGDFNVEQHVHSIDKVLWAMRDVPPVKCTGSGGRQARTGAESGNVYDHFSVVYEFANGVKAFTSCRQIDGCDDDVSDHVFGTKGVCDIFKHRITGDNPWAFKGKGGAMYVREHEELYASIRAGKPINNGDYMTKSTLMAIMGRMSAYTGKVITWDQALNSKERMAPAEYKWGPIDVPPVPTPGVTLFT